MKSPTRLLVLFSTAHAFHLPNHHDTILPSTRRHSTPTPKTPTPPQRTAPLRSYYIDTSESTPRDLTPMISWCESYGVQRNALEFASTSNFNGGHPGIQSQDMSAYASQDLPAGTPVLFVPRSLFLSSYTIKHEEFGASSLLAAEEYLTKLREPLPLFYLYVKVLYEYSLGEQSPYYEYLNSLPRHYDTGTSMTPTCYECLPPLAGTYAKNERVRYINYRTVAQTVGWLDSSVKEDRDVSKWVFNVVSTRSWEVPDGSGERVIVPMADMFNHHYDPEVAISYDEEGNCIAYTIKDVSAGSPLRISYGFDANPSALFAKYGFVDTSAPATFWKYMDIIPSTELCSIGLSYSRMLFYPSGDISPEIFDVLLYLILGEKRGRQEQKVFYDACLNGDDETKMAYLNQYYYEIYGRIKTHVDKFLGDLQELEGKAIRVDKETHPRIGMIREHNDFVRGIFLRVKENVDAVVAQAA
eukprot:CCRYP_014310-RA/>CCRYP_014310-RA protein AED:0.09 eAED:0.09 QI:65/1/0.75/1/0.66/0.5/4/763/469